MIRRGYLGAEGHACVHRSHPGTEREREMLVLTEPVTLWFPLERDGTTVCESEGEESTETYGNLHTSAVCFDMELSP